jgi:hydroxypyruvate isomerase
MPKSVTRRSVLKAAAATAAGAALPHALRADTMSLPSTKGPFKLNYAPHFGMFAAHAPDELDQVRFAADEGFLAWEDNGMSGRGSEFQNKFAKLMAEKEMTMGIFVAHRIDWSNPTLTSGDRAAADAFVSDIKNSTDVAKRVNAKWVTTVVGRSHPGLPFGYQFTNVVDTLRRACEVCEPSGMVMVLEPLNWRDHPGMFLATTDICLAVVRAVNHPCCRILQDLYHLQIQEGNLIDHMDRAWNEIAYFQLGDNPGRMEPGTGEVNYRNVFRHIHGRGFKGVLGMEHGKSQGGKEGERKLIEAYRSADDF